MCGIAGYFSDSFDGLESHAQAMTTALIHRGPDSSGVWLDSSLPLALGHRRLAILDLSAAGHQPMLSASSRYVIVFNGEIFNFKALRNELLSLGHSFRGSGDTEVMLASFEQWGVTQAVNRFVGMFAFAVWDQKDKILSLVRDRLGIKPLYYGWDSGGFVFASDISAIRALPSSSAPIDAQAATLLLRYGYVPAPYSILRGIWKLLPGSIIELSPEELKKRPDDFSPEAGSDGTNPLSFWSVPEVAHHASTLPISGDNKTVLDDFEKLLSESISLRLVSDVPIGAFLSGGIDSSLVTALMTKLHGQTVKTFSVGFEDSDYDESDFARAVAKHLGTDHEELRLSEADLLGVVPQLGNIFDEPFADSSQIPMYLVSKLARRSVTVALSGDGGDELFCGYNRYVWPRRLWRALEKLPIGVRQALKSPLHTLSAPWVDAALRPLIGLLPLRFQVDRPAERLRKLHGVLTAPSLEALYYTVLENWGELTPPVKNYSDRQSFYAERNAFSRIQPLEQQMMFLDQQIYLPDDNLVKVDRASMACSLEVRVPMLDHRVVAFAARLPFEQKYRRGQTKWILRQLLHRYIPKELVERPKMGFSVPLTRWLRGPLRPWADDLLQESTLQKLDFLDPAAIHRTWNEHKQGKVDHAHRLWAVLMLVQWHQAARASSAHTYGASVTPPQATTRQASDQTA